MRTLILFLTLALDLFGGVFASVIDPELELLLRSKSNDKETVPVLISFEQTIMSVIDRINSQSFSSIVEKRTALTEAQIRFTDKVQENLRTHLDLEKVPYKSYWINNKVVIPAADLPLVRSLSLKTGINGIARVQYLPEPVSPYLREQARVAPEKISIKDNSPKWQLTKIRAPQAWQMGYTGRGIVVGHIDKGVRYTHEAIRHNWRTEYGWYDPSGEYRTPQDPINHGTAAMALLAGREGIGVAPEATWIACRNTDSFACGQWIQCPTRSNGSGRDCSKAPHVVSNSWGWETTRDDIYSEVVASWKAAGIIPVFGIGNTGPNCASKSMSPANSGQVIGVGATDNLDRLAEFSSRGPRRDNNTRFIPDIVAPGQDVITASNAGDNIYLQARGTSFSTPLVAGIVALMKQKNPRVDYDTVWRVLLRNTNKQVDPTGTEPCGGVSSNQ